MLVMQAHAQTIWTGVPSSRRRAKPFCAAPTAKMAVKRLHEKRGKKICCAALWAAARPPSAVSYASDRIEFIDATSTLRRRKARNFRDFARAKPILTMRHREILKSCPETVLCALGGWPCPPSGECGRLSGETGLLLSCLTRRSHRIMKTFPVPATNRPLLDAGQAGGSSRPPVQCTRGALAIESG